ncbi:MAG: diguanylate cyclase [Coriobacteriia bacterium]|nr:diguanylate cyclase [Coriobacteriia bacterium]
MTRGARAEGTRVTEAGTSWGTPLLYAVAGLVFAVLATMYLGSNSLPLSLVARFLISEVAFIIPILGATVAGWFVHRRAAGAESRFWLLLTCVNAVLVVSELYYIYWVAVIDIAGPPPVYAPFQIMHITAAVLLLAMLLSMTKFQNATSTMRLRWALDMASGATIAFVLLFELVVNPLFANVPLLPAERFAAAAYPTMGLAMLVGTVATLLGFKVARWRPWERLVALSLCIYAAGLCAWPLWLVAVRTEGASFERGLVDIVLLLGQYLLFVAAVARLRGTGQQWPLRPMPLFQPARRRVLGLVLPTVSMAAVPIFTFLAFRAGPGTLDFIVYLGATSLLAAAMVVRSTVVAAENGKLFHRAVTDAITGLFNLRFMHERLVIETGVAARYGEQLSLVVLDIDDFELVNDLHGHPVGDELLREFGAVLKGACRDSDIVCRIGGDEFAAVLPDASPTEALKVCLRIQYQLSRLRPPSGAPLTASIGVATFPDHASSADELVRFAHGARYWVKRHGKDHVLVYDPSVVAELDDDDRIRALEQQSHVGAIRALAAAVDARDAATQDHSRSVAILAVEVARELGLEDQRVRLLESAALMHDVGKIGVPDDILRKAGPLTAEERVRVSEHPALGERILSSTSQRQMLPWVRHHHERWDGSGYPDKLRAIEIPLEARILAVCDAYDAMVSDRPYRPALSVEEAAAELEAGMGTQFDPSVVEVFLRTLGHELVSS